MRKHEYDREALTRRQLVKLHKQWTAARRARSIAGWARYMHFDDALPHLLQQRAANRYYRWKARRVSKPEGKFEQWGDGPWVNEPDRVEFESHGYACVMRRNFMRGTWCGYVGVPEGHPNYGKWDESLDVHGGVTYAEDHFPESGKPRSDLWWTGFDCGHAFDYAPADAAMWREVGMKMPERMRPEWAALEEGRLPWDLHSTYLDAEYVRGQVEGLAAQLAAMTAPAQPTQQDAVIAEIADAMQLPANDVRDLLGVEDGEHDE